MSAFSDRQGVLPGRYAVSIDIHDGSHLRGDVRYLTDPSPRSAKVSTSGLEAVVPDDESSVEIDFDLK